MNGLKELDGQVGRLMQHISRNIRDIYAFIRNLRVIHGQEILKRRVSTGKCKVTKKDTYMQQLENARFAVRYRYQ